MGIGAFSMARALHRWPAYALIFSQIHRSKNRSGASDSNTLLRIDRVPPYGPIKVMAGNLRRGHLRRSKPPDPTFYHSIRLIDDDRKPEAELLNARLELADVLGRVLVGFSSERPQAVDVDQSWMKIARNSIAVTAQH